MQVKENLGLLIFGASGDLAARRWIPALYDLFYQKSYNNSFLDQLEPALKSFVNYNRKNNFVFTIDFVLFFLILS